MHAKLHRWAVADRGRLFDDLFNFVYDPATLIVAFDRVATNQGPNIPGTPGSYFVERITVNTGTARSRFLAAGIRPASRNRRTDH